MSTARGEVSVTPGEVSIYNCKMMGKISRSPTISVSPPQTPDSYSDPFRYSLPMPEDSNVVTELRNENADLKKEIADLKETFNAKFEKQEKENEKLFVSIKDLEMAKEQLVKKYEGQSKILKHLIRSDLFDKLVDDLDSQGLQRMVENMNSKSDDAISKELLGVPAHKSGELLNTLALYLKARDDFELDEMVFHFFVNINPFALKDVSLSGKSPSGTNNKFLETHILETNEKYVTQAKQTYEFFDAFVEQFPPKFAHLLPLLLSNYRIDGQKGEVRASLMVRDKVDCVCDFLNRPRVSGKKLKVIEQFLVKSKSSTMKIDIAVLRGMTEFLFLEVKESLGKLLCCLDGLKSLPKSLDPVLKQVFAYLMMTGIRKAILTDGVVYIKIDISQEVFFKKRKEFKKSHIVPYKFQIMHFKDALFNKALINWFLEAEMTRRSKVRQMEIHYRKKYYQPNQPKTYQRRLKVYKGKYQAKSYWLKYRLE